MKNTKIEQELLQLIITEPELTPESIRLIIQIVRNDRSTRQRNSTSRNVSRTIRKPVRRNNTNTRLNSVSSNTKSVSFGSNPVENSFGSSRMFSGNNASRFNGSSSNDSFSVSGIGVGFDSVNGGLSGNVTNSLTSLNDEIEPMDTSPDGPVTYNDQKN